MKSITKKLITLLLALTLVAAMPAAAFAEGETVPVSIEADRYDAAAWEVLELVNAEREKAGLHPLKLDSKLQEAAMVRAAESTVYFSHTRPDGTGCWTAGPESMAGENLAVGQTNPQQVVNAWMNSPSHRANILHKDYNSIGIGCINYNGIWFWSQAFARTSGDGNIPEDKTAVQQDVNLLRGLLELKWLGDTEFNLAENEAVAHQIHIGAVNPGWEYMITEMDPQLFTILSTDESVMKTAPDGTLIPGSVGTATITASLKADDSIILAQKVQVSRKLKAEDVKLSYSSCTYNGKAKKPDVTIEGLTEDDYVVSYKNNVKVGTATVTITGVGDVSGTVTRTFKINHDRPDQVSLKSPTTGKTHYVKARWYDEDCDGYQIRYATNSSFKNSKSICVKDGDQLTRTIKNLKKGKRYYVKVRAYNNYEDTKVFGKWSKWKSVVCK